MQQIFSNLTQGINYAKQCLRNYGQVIKADNKWQGVKINRSMFEVDNVYFRCCMPQSPIALEEQVKPDMPWAEDHFQERVGGKPLNPGEQYKNWIGYKAENKDWNDLHFRPEGVFTHTYMERYWPRYAGEKYKPFLANPQGHFPPHCGVRYEYGDLLDVINLLYKEPFTRQAYLPIWFPEDTGVLHGGRVPCSIGYHFMRKGDDLNIHYMIRACDYIRHFRNDIYLTVRLAQWVLDRVKRLSELDSNANPWTGCQLGIFTMDIVHFHVFESERNLI